MDQSARLFESAEIEQLIASSTSGLGPRLESARKQWRYHPFVLFAALIVVGVANSSGLQPLAVGAFLLGGVTWAGTYLLDRKRLTTTLEYKLDDDHIQTFSKLVSAFEELAKCARVWRIPRETDQRDRKRHAGAGVTVERQRIGLRLGLPDLIESNLKFPSFPLGKETIYFAPDTVLIVARNSVAALPYDDFELIADTTRFIEDEVAPPDTQVVGTTWQYVNKNGGPDRRFSNNSQLPICIYGQIDLKSTGGLNERLYCSRSDAAEHFVACTVGMRRLNSSARAMRDEVETVDTKATPASPSVIAKAIGSTATAPTLGDLASAYKNETETAKKLALEHGKFWEYALVQELLESRIASLEKEYTAYQTTITTRDRVQCSLSEFGNLVVATMNKVATMISRLKICLERDLTNAMGRPGEPGDALAILMAVNKISGCFLVVMNCEREICSVDPPERLKAIAISFRGLTRWIIEFAIKYKNNWAKNLEGIKQGSKQFNAIEKITIPPQFEMAMKEIKKLKE
jgi:hypothetical protein